MGGVYRKPPPGSHQNDWEASINWFYDGRQAQEWQHTGRLLIYDAPSGINPYTFSDRTTNSTVGTFRAGSIVLACVFGVVFEIPVWQTSIIFAFGTCCFFSNRSVFQCRSTYRDKPDNILVTLLKCILRSLLVLQPLARPCFSVKLVITILCSRRLPRNVKKI